MEDFVSLLNTLEPGIVIFDGEYKIRHINRMVLLLFSEFSSADIFDKPLLSLHRHASAEKISRMIELLKTSKRPVPFSIKIFSKDRQSRYLFMKLISLLSSDLHEALCCALMYDITAFISDKSTHLLKIPVGVKNEIKLIDLKDVTYIEADNVYSRVHTGSGAFFSGLSLGVLHNRLPHKYFFRIHRSYIINLEKVEKVIKDGGSVYVRLEESDVNLPVSRNRARVFFERLGLK